MPVKTSRILLGDINGEAVYAIGPYAQRISDIVMSQAKEIRELKEKVVLKMAKDFDNVFDGEYSE